MERGSARRGRRLASILVLGDLYHFVYLVPLAFIICTSNHLIASFVLFFTPAAPLCSLPLHSDQQ